MTPREASLIEAYREAMARRRTATPANPLQKYIWGNVDVSVFVPAPHDNERDCAVINRAMRLVGEGWKIPDAIWSADRERRRAG